MHVFYIVVTLLCAQTLAREPHCSKFAYDEALLEKMIRTEVKFEQLQTEFEEHRDEMKVTYNKLFADLQNMANKVSTMLDTVAETLKDIQKDRTSMNEAFSSLNESTKRMADELVQDMKEKLQHKERQVARMSEDLRSLFTDIRENITATVSTPVIAFKATDSRTKQHLSSDSVISFPTVLFNTGSGYSTSDSKFTASVKGLYIFTVQICVNTNDYFSGKIVVDETEVGRFQAVDHTLYTCNTGDAITEMDVGQKAYVKVINAAWTNHNKDRLSSFSGALLRKIK